MTDMLPRHYSLSLKFLMTLVPLLSGCLSSEQDPDGGDTACTQLYAYGATVRVKDASTGAPLASASVTARSSTGEEAPAFESWSETEPGTWVGLGETTGEWTISAQATGYVSQSRTVTLESDGCHVIGQTLEFALERE